MLLTITSNAVQSAGSSGGNVIVLVLQIAHWAVVVAALITGLLLVRKGYASHT